MENCPICKLGSVTTTSSNPIDTVFSYTCNKCGPYSISAEALELVQDEKFVFNCPKTAAFLRARSLSNEPPVILLIKAPSAAVQKPSITLQETLDQFPAMVADRFDRVLLNLSKLSKFAGQSIELHHEDYSLFYADSQNTDSFAFMVEALYKTGLIEYSRFESDGSFASVLLLGLEIRLSAEGWNRVYSISTRKIRSTNVFIAMSFNAELMEVYSEGIAKAIADCGYKPIRVDMIQHNDDITDKIIAEIRQSRFVVCDFTDHKAGVYFEAGFALGLDIPVIRTCRDDHKEQMHFDTRQYNHILWKTKEDLYESLRDRIKATIL
jgi:nucleoside 2-deoxyribosyltransferase